METAVETASTQTMSASADGRKQRCRRRLKPRLHKRCPPPRTEQNKVILTALQPAEAGFVCIDAVSTAESSSTRGGGFCLYRRGFNRRVFSVSECHLNSANQGESISDRKQHLFDPRIVYNCLVEFGDRHPVSSSLT